MDKFTPGPWKLIVSKPTKKDPQGCTMIATPHGYMAIDCYRSGQSHDEDAANARLITAAPDLLGALRNLVADVTYLIDDGTLPLSANEHPSINTARAAITKATGA